MADPCPLITALNHWPAEDEGIFAYYVAVGWLRVTLESFGSTVIIVLMFQLHTRGDYTG